MVLEGTQRLQDEKGIVNSATNSVTYNSNLPVRYTVEIVAQMLQEFSTTL